MNRAGKPLRFLGAVIGGWVVLRLGVVAMPLFLEPEEDMEIASTDKSTLKKRTPTLVRPGAVALQASPIEPAILSQSHPDRWLPPRANGTAQAPRPSLPPRMPEKAPPASALIATASVPAPAASAQPKSQSEAPTQFPASISQASRASRWSLTGWMLWRREAGSGLAQAPLLGGSQAGARLDYALWSGGGRSLSLYGRVTRAMERPYAEEAALGISLRPVGGLPISLLAERRQRLGAGSRSGFAFMAAGGIGPKAVAPRLEVEGYAQAGIVALPGSDGFADGRISLDYRLTRKSAQPDLAVGVAVSGAVQTGTSRLDIGPEVRLRLPIAGGHMRLSAEWRQRVSGNARPASGPTIAMVADF